MKDFVDLFYKKKLYGKVKLKLKLQIFYNPFILF